VTNRAWDPAVNAPLSHGKPTTTFIGDYFGLATSTLGFFPFWTDTRTGIQEIFAARLAVNPASRYERTRCWSFSTSTIRVGGHKRALSGQPRGIAGPGRVIAGQSSCISGQRRGIAGQQRLLRRLSSSIAGQPRSIAGQRQVRDALGGLAVDHHMVETV
jgi:hypothetical protein